jgi:hypothetical protein
VNIIPWGETEKYIPEGYYAKIAAGKMKNSKCTAYAGN